MGEMIQANELRCGNLVSYDNRVFEIDTIAKEFPTLNTIDFGIGVVDWNNIKPIPITEEWLLSLGFEQTYNSEFRHKFDHKTNHFIGFDFSKVEDKSMDGFRYYGHYIKINYIHQLQNLYFALTQKELTLNE